MALQPWFKLVGPLGGFNFLLLAWQLAAISSPSCPCLGNPGRATH